MLDGMVVDATTMIRDESPEPRRASLSVGSAKENRDAARLDLDTLKTKRDNAMTGVTDGAQLRQISQSWEAPIAQAEERLAAAEQALRDALGTVVLTAEAVKKGANVNSNPGQAQSQRSGASGLDEKADHG